MAPFDQDDARQAGEIRAHLASKGRPIGPYDVLIAGQAKARKLTLVTHNTTELTFRNLDEGRETSLRRLAPRALLLFIALLVAPRADAAAG